MKCGFLGLVFVLIGLQNAQAQIDPDSLVCGATINGEKVPLNFNPLGGKFDYSGKTKDGLIMIYVRYDALLDNIPSKVDRVELTLIETPSDKQYEALNKMAGGDPDLKNYQKARITQNTVALYDGFVNFDTTQGSSSLSISCRKQ